MSTADISTEIGNTPTASVGESVGERIRAHINIKYAKIFGIVLFLVIIIISLYYLIKKYTEVPEVPKEKKD